MKEIERADKEVNEGYDKMEKLRAEIRELAKYVKGRDAETIKSTPGLYIVILKIKHLKKQYDEVKKKTKSWETVYEHGHKKLREYFE